MPSMRYVAGQHMLRALSRSGLSLRKVVLFGQIISKLDLKGVSVDTKFDLGFRLETWATFSDCWVICRIYPANPGDNSAARLKELVQESVTALNGVKIRTLYLHKPDRSVPFVETVGAIDELHKKGILCVLVK